KPLSMRIPPTRYALTSMPATRLPQLARRMRSTLSKRWISIMPKASVPRMPEPNGSAICGSLENGVRCGNGARPPTGRASILLWQPGRDMIEALKAKLGAEVEKLQYELNVTLPNEIRKAVELGDLRENSEYKAALERQQFVQARLGQLRQRLSKLSSIDPTQIPADRVGLGS